MDSRDFMITAHGSYVKWPYRATLAITYVIRGKLNIVKSLNLSLIVYV